MALPAVIMVIVGTIGLLISLLKHTSKNRWMGLLKKGLIILFAVIILFVIRYLVLSFFDVRIISSSFVGDTEVLTPNGRVKISELKEADQVLSFKSNTKTVTVEKVEQYKAYDTNLYYIINDSLKVTPEHPIAVQISGNIVWRRVKNLTVGDILVGSDTTPEIVKSIKKIFLDKTVTVYNPQISGEHNYFIIIGDNAVLVHNKTYIPITAPE